MTRHIPTEANSDNFLAGKLRCKKGQALSYMLVLIMVLVMSWAMLVNVEKLLSDRMVLQNAADNAALSVAVYKARVLNKVGYINYLIGCTLYDGPIGLLLGLCETDPPGLFSYNYLAIAGGTYGWCTQVGAPVLPMCLADDQTRVASCLDTMHGNYCSGTDGEPDVEQSRYIKITMDIVKVLAKAQEGYYRIYPANASIYAWKIAERQAKDASGNFNAVDGLIDAEVISGNTMKLIPSKKVKYFKTRNFCASIPQNPYIPPGLHTHTGIADELDSDERASWVYADKDSFDKSCRVTVLVRRLGNSPANKGFPFFAKWLGIEYPDMYAVASAAVYNRKGRMFPMYSEGQESNSIKEVIEEYGKAKDGGWEAHLVPVNKAGIQH